jgi:hypothetical protein
VAPPAQIPGAAIPFTKLEQVVADDINTKQGDLQQEINDFMRECKLQHPGYEFRNGMLMPTAPPAAPDPAKAAPPAVPAPVTPGAQVAAPPTKP